VYAVPRSVGFRKLTSAHASHSSKEHVYKCSFEE